MYEKIDMQLIISNYSPQITFKYIPDSQSKLATNALIIREPVCRKAG